MKNKFLTISQAAKFLNVSQDTLRKWDIAKKLVPIKTCGGHRRYSIEQLNSLVGIKATNIEKNQNLIAIYARVSSHDQKQKGDLDRQFQRLTEFCIKNKYTIIEGIKDVGSGLSDSRTGFVKLTNLVIKQGITKIVIENKDRLTRFQFGFIEKMFNSYGVEIICIEQKEVNEDEELINDMMMLIASFSGKLYGRRSSKRRKDAKSIKN